MKLKKITSIFCAGALLFGYAAAPIGQASAAEIDAPTSGAEPIMPKEIAEREATVHTYDMKNYEYGNTGGDGPWLDGALIMPGDTIYIPIDVRDYKSGYCVLFAGSYNVLDSGQTSSDTSPYFQLVESKYNYTDGFVREGEITNDDLGFVTRVFTSPKTHEQKEMVFNEMIVNSLNTPIVVGMNETGDGGAIVDGYTQFYFVPTLTTYSPYYKITYPDGTYEGGYDGLDTYFWPQGEFSTLSFPSEYWLTDVPYAMTLPNPVKRGYHFKSWGDADSVTQENTGMYTNITVQWSTNKYSKDIFSRYGDRKLEPKFENGKTIAFEGSGGTIKGFDEYIAEVPDTNDGTFALEDYAPVKEGNTFLGWCTKEAALYGSFVTLDDEDVLYDTVFTSRTTDVTLYAKWASDTYETLEKSGWDITDDGTLWLLNNDGASAWVEARDGDTSLAEKVKDVKLGYKDEQADYLPYYCFKGCKNLTDLVLEENVRLGGESFEGCDNLKTVTLNSDPYSGVDYCFKYAPKDVVVKVPSDKLDSYKTYLGDFAYLLSADKRYGLTVGGQLITEISLTVQCGEGTATFDPETNTLVLDNADIPAKTLTPHWLDHFSDRENWTWYNNAAIVSDIDGLNIELKGDNIVRSTGDYKYDLVRSYNDVNISGDGDVECVITVENYLVQDENGDMVPYSGVYTLPITAEGNVTIKDISARRLNIENAGDLTVDGATLSGGVFKPKNNLNIQNDALIEHYTPVGTTGTYDRLDDVTPTLGGQQISVSNSKFDYVTIDAGDVCDSITIENGDIQLTGKLNAANHTQLTLTNTTLKAYGQSDGVTNIPVENIKLDNCEISQGEWTKSGYFVVMPTSSDTDSDTASDENTDTESDTAADENTDTEIDTASDENTDTEIDTASDENSDTESDTAADENTDTESDTATDENIDTESDTASDENTETEIDTAADENTDTEIDTAADENTDTEIDTAADENTDTESDTAADENSDTESDTAADENTDTEIDTASDENSDTESDTATDENTDTEIDTATDENTDMESDTAADTETDSEESPDVPNFDDEKKDWTPEQTEGLTLTIKNASESDLTGITLNGETVDPSKYTVKKTDGGITITLSSEYLQTLSTGSYTMSASFANGTAETKIDVENEPKPAGILGDLDGDTQITSADALVILRMSVGAEEINLTLADVDGDGMITSADALAVLRASVGMDDGGKIGEKVAE